MHHVQVQLGFEDREKLFLLSRLEDRSMAATLRQLIRQEFERRKLKLPEVIVDDA